MASFISRSIAVMISLPFENRFTFNSNQGLAKFNNCNLFRNPRRFFRLAGEDLRISLLFVTLYTTLLGNLRSLEATKCISFGKGKKTSDLVTSVIAGGLSGAIIGGATYHLNQIKKLNLHPKVLRTSNFSEVLQVVQKEVTPKAKKFTRRTFTNIAWTLGTRSYFFLIINTFKNFGKKETNH